MEGSGEPVSPFDSYADLTALRLARHPPLAPMDLGPAAGPLSDAAASAPGRLGPLGEDGSPSTHSGKIGSGDSSAAWT